MDFVNIFSNLAVPVACLVCTFYLWNKEREDHKTEQKELTEAIANNTLVIQKLVDRMDGDKQLLLMLFSLNKPNHRSMIN